MIKPIRVTAKRRALVNPSRPAKSKSSGAKRRKKRNPGVLAALGYLNPKGASKVKKATKKHSKKRRSNPTVKVITRRARPVIAKRRNGRRRKNPSFGALSKPIDMLKSGAAAAAALVVTRQVPQMVLGTKNTGWMGYLANFLVALGTSAIVGKTAGTEYGKAAAIGGGAYIVNRVLNDFTPLGKSLNLSGCGDPAASGRLGALVPAYYAHPPIEGRNGVAIPAAIRDYVAKQIPAPAASGSQSSGVGRFAGRF